jgi:isopenicillin N synthase-like dioxygenase
MNLDSDLTDKSVITRIIAMRVLTVDFNDKDASVKFTESLKNTGFAVIKNHPIELSLIAKVYKEWDTFFKSEEKNNYLFNRETQDGYFPMMHAETAKGGTSKDIKELFQIYPWGQYPARVSDAARELYIQLSSLAAILLQWLEDNTPLKISQGFFMPLSHMIYDSPRTMLRIIHYPPLTGNEDPGAMRAAAHEDINLLTLFVGATEPGLQVKDSEGVWHEIKSDPSTIVVNTGDMLQMCSQGYYKSTTHRVVNPQGEAARLARLAMLLFLHPNDDVQLSSSHTAMSYLQERLHELGLKA